MNPLISICIPSFKNAEYVKRLLDSISIQTFKDFEVIITDDSNDDSVAGLVPLFREKFPITYKKNNTPLGSPENWNEAIRQSKAIWIKMMHDDDWFADTTSLQKFADATIDPETNFVFSGYYNVDSALNKKKKFVIGETAVRSLRRSSLHLFKKNFIGHPSTTLIRKDAEFIYDKNLKWVVDFEFYMRYIRHKNGLMAIKEPLINIGLNEFQVTKESFGNRAVEIPEIIYLYHTIPENSLKNIYVYDYYWRSIRNLRIRTREDMEKYLKNDKDIPVILENMITIQSKWPSKLLRSGFISKGLMFFSYLTNYHLL